jgi:hypothetical protein
MAALHSEVVQEQLTRMEHNARDLFERGDLGPDVSLAQARDVMLVYGSPELCELLVAPAGVAAGVRRLCGTGPDSSAPASAGGCIVVAF